MSSIILPDNKEAKTITPQALNDMSNCIMAVLCDPDTKEMQLVINGSNEFVLATALRRLDRAVDGHLYNIEQHRLATSIQKAPASVLDRLNA